ncbi:Leucine-rich repeat domain superfamily [Sesbania bispinosa]|nr:Leucine-rich repeat domain superfamily [Sesbania bispinosa]
MVSNEVPLHRFSGRKRKRMREHSANCVEEGARLKEIQGEKGLDQMDQEIQGEKDLDKMDQEIQGEKGLEQMDQVIQGEKDLDQMDQEIQGEKGLDQMDQVIQGEKDLDQMDQEIQGEKDLDQMDQIIESMDRISHLPDHVIHRILSRLRNVKDIVRTSILSKRWRALWYSFSILIFDERKFTAGIVHEDSSHKEKMFRDHVSSSLHTQLEKKLYLQKLVVHMTSFDLEDAPHVDRWLSVAIANNIKEIDLHVGIKNSQRYTLPQTIFSSRTLTGLRLSGCILQTSNDIMLPHLQKLYLRKLRLVEHIIQNLLSSCPSIEDLRFIQCSGLKLLHVSNLIGLKRVEIHYCNQLKKVEISAPNLHTFWYCGKKSTPCKVSLEGCNSLKRLTLEHPQVTREFCENLISSFPLLEKLDLSISNKMKYITISSPRLRKIALKGCKKLGFALIYAPNLLSLECKGEAMPYIHLNPFCLTDAKFSFEPKSEHKDIGHGNKFWINMGEIIRRFDPEGFKLLLHSNKNIVIHEDLKNITLPPLPDLGVEIIKSSACIDDILYSLLRTLHPVSLSIVSPIDSKFPKFVYEMIKNKNEDPICCRYNTSNNKCWRHFLMDVNFEDLKDMKFEAIEANEDKRTSTWYNWLKSSYSTVECQEGKATNKKKNVTVGPWGGNGGTSWDDGTFTGVREVTLVYDRCIDSIRVVYDKNGKPFTAEKHGGVGGSKTAEIKLQYPEEFLISVSGHYTPVVRGGTPVIRSLTFKSNRRTFGPYGVEEGTPFTFSIDGGQVVGFKGRGDWYLDSIAFTLSSAPSKSLLQKMQKGLLYRLTSIAPKSSSSKKG